MIEKYIKKIEHIDISSESFIIRQLNRMPDHYYLALYIICTIFYLFRIESTKFQLLDKLISSLYIVKSYED